MSRRGPRKKGNSTRNKDDRLIEAETKKLPIGRPAPKRTNPSEERVTSHVGIGLSRSSDNEMSRGATTYRR